MNEYDWWSLALTGQKVEINADVPQSGFYMSQTVALRAGGSALLPI